MLPVMNFREEIETNHFEILKQNLAAMKNKASFNASFKVGRDLMLEKADEHEMLMKIHNADIFTGSGRPNVCTTAVTRPFRQLPHCLWCAVGTTFFAGPESERQPNSTP